jgi:type IV pilus assembly protein PilN
MSRQLDWLQQDWDLLREQRLQRGLPAAAAPLIPARQLLLKGSAGGAALAAIVLLVWGWIALRQHQVNTQLDGLRAIPPQVVALENQTLSLRRQITQQERSNTALAQGLADVSSSSALLAALGRATLEGMQLTEVAVRARNLALKGVALDPQAFWRINSFQLLLGRSPLLAQASVKVKKLSREAASNADKGPPQLPPVGWEINAAFQTIPPEQQQQVLKALGADGMARRLQILKQAGVLP